MQQSKNERLIFEVFMNANAAEALALLDTAQKILIARNLVKPARVRGKKGKADAAKQD